MNHLRDVLRYWAGSHVFALSYWVRHVLPKRRAMGRTRRLQGTRRDRRVLVFASGPSMRQLDPRKIRLLQETAGFDVFGLNAYVTTEFGRVAPPDVYVLSDPASWSRAISDAKIQHLDEAGRAAFRARFDQSVRDTWDELWRLNPVLFVPAEQYPVAGYSNAFPFCASSNIFSSNVYDVTRPLGIRPYTAYRALSLACYLGYKEIYFCGIDNDTFKKIVVDDENVKWSRYEHFYDDASSVQDVPSRETLYRGLYFTALSFGCLEAFRGYPIVNLDSTGLVDVFPKQHRLDVYWDAPSERLPPDPTKRP